MPRPGLRARRRRHPKPTPDSIASHILVATEGSAAVSPEILAASAIAARHGSRVDVLSVVVPQLSAPLVAEMGVIEPVYEVPPPRANVRTRRHHIRDELHRAGRPEWKETIVTGWPANEIPAVARRLGATLIVMGIGRHAPIDRLLGSETVLQVLPNVDVPVLAVARDLTGLPRRALAAVDFSVQSEAAAHAVAELLGEDGTLVLTHVRNDPAGLRNVKAPVDLYAAGVEQHFAGIERQLPVARGASSHVERVVRHGDPASELRDLAELMNADLVAVGAQTHGRLHRIFLGSVAAKLLRSLPCSVLIIPARAEARRSGKPQRAKSAMASTAAMPEIAP